MKNCNIYPISVFIPRPLSSALKRKHPALQNNILYRYIFFLFSFSVGHFGLAHLDPDPEPADQNQCGSVSTTMHTVPYTVGTAYGTEQVNIRYRIKHVNLFARKLFSST